MTDLRQLPGRRLSGIYGGTAAIHWAATL